MNFRHGHKRAGHCSPEYHSWINAKSRCENPRHPRYAEWGGRGITICDRWRHSFDAFLEDMGLKPEGYSIDRIDNDGPYSPDNCRWATASQQMKNRRKFRRAA